VAKRWKMRWTAERLIAVVVVSCLWAGVGCKTSDDAKAASEQMAVTAKTLCDYYASVRGLLADTDQIHLLNKALADKPYSPAVQGLVKKTEAELDKRVALADQLSKLADSFAKLNSSTAAADVAASAGKLDAAIEALEPMKSTSTEQAAIKVALKLLVTAVQEKKEREAARAMDDLARGLHDLFVQEAPVWSSTEQVHSALASVLAESLVDEDAVDESGLLVVTLKPFGLAPAMAPKTVNRQLAPLAKEQIADRHKALDDDFAKATECMEKALGEMSARIHLVATEQPMRFRAEPLTLETVKKWAAEASALR
jgi:hypothetical protein